MKVLARSIETFAVVCVLVLIVAVSAIATTWDAYSEFSTTTSNNLPWQYGYRNTAASTDFNFYSTLGFQYAGYDFWCDGTGNIGHALLGKSTTNQDLGQHPGPSPENSKSVLRWVSPVLGDVVVYAKWYGSNQFIPTTDVHIVVNGTSIWDALVLASTSPTQEHAAVLNVAVGSTIDFVLGNKDGNYGNDMTRLIATVSTPSSTPGTISGYVVSDDSGNPSVSGALVRVTDSGGAYVGDTYANNDGYYSLRLVPGTYTVECSKIGYFTENESLTLDPGADETVDFTLTAAGVYDCYSDFSMTSNPNGCWQYGFKSSVTSNDMILYVLPLKTYDPFQSWTYNNVDTGGFVGLDTLNHNSSGYGIGMHPGNNDVKAAIRWTSPLNGYVTINAAWNYFAQATTDAHVVLNETELWSGNINALSAPNAAYLSIQEVQIGDTLDFVLSDGGNQYGSDCTQCRINVSKAGPTGTISGRVTSNLNGNPPVAGASVQAGEYLTKTATDGTYFINVPSGTYTVAASKTGHISDSVDNVDVTLNTVTPNVDFVLDTAVLSGNVKANLTDSPAIRGAVVGIDDGTNYTKSTEDGSYSINVLPGSYDVMAQAGGYISSALENITFNSGETVTRNYDLVLANSSDVTTDFTTKANPNGIYTYGYITSDVFSIYPLANWEFYTMKWWGDQNWAGGAIGKNLNYSVAYIGGDKQYTTVPAGQMVMFPHQYSPAIRWTAPKNGRAEINFAWSDLSYPSNAETETCIKHNGVDIATGAIDGANGVTQSSFGPLQMSVSKGDTIDFVLSPGAIKGVAEDVNGISGSIGWMPASSVGTISGKVTNVADGAAIKGVTITTNSSPAQVATTDANGDYTLTLLPNTYTLTTSKYPYFAQTSNPIAVAVGDAKTQNFALVVDESLLAIVTGTVTSAISGDPIEGVVVTADSGETTTTNASGYYRLALNPGAHTISAAKEHFSADAISVTAPVADANISMMPDAVLVSTITEAKAHMNEFIRINTPKVVTVSTIDRTDGSFYIEEPERNCGLKVIGYSGMPGLKADKRVVLTGIIKTDSTGDEYLELSSVDSQADGDPVGALGMNNKAAVEPIAQDLLVKVWGKVTSVANDKSYFYVNDGSNVSDGTNNVGIKVDYSNSTVPRIASIFENEVVSVTGVMGHGQDGINVIRPRTSLDVKNTVIDEVTVTPSDTSWIKQVNPGDVATTGSVVFASAPDSVYGTGSIQMSVGADGSGVINLRTDNHKNTLLTDITELSITNYMTYFSTTMEWARGIGVRMSVKLDDILGNSEIDTTGYVDDILTCEPKYDAYSYAMCKLNGWVTFDAINSGRWYSSRHLDGSNEAGVFNKLSDYMTLFPQAAIAPVGNGGLRFFMGGVTGEDYWTNVTGYIDNVRFGTKDGTTVYNFEQ
ncbi:MAG: carboxypeptidase-like regulatory domain-containing protein [Armatimonadota bacterium]|nr:carboxypeptidase regulatory-like domain-containing protein [bacterium]